VFCEPALYRERFCLCAKQSSLDDAVTRMKIVAFVRALIEATRRLRSDPRRAQQLVAQQTALDRATVQYAWPFLDYPGTLTGDLLDALQPVEVWLTSQAGQAPRGRGALDRLIDHSVLQEALARPA
jgi:NitT/TauT family transport system substrate-binding protein